MLGVTLKNINIGKVNSGGKCDFCNTRNIFYSILNGNYIYFCKKCNKWIDKKSIKA